MSKPKITITYCRQCNWLLRSAWMAQELLSTFSEELGGVTLVPGTGGVFTIDVAVDEGHSGEARTERIWDRVRDGGFPEIKVLRGRVRDIVDPERSLGHTDRALGAKADPAAEV